jgi:hypothetical protein
MADERVLTEDEIETLAWELEPKMMAIRKDPRAALADGLAKIRSTMLAEYEAYMAKKGADFDAEFAAFKTAKIEAVDAQLRDKTQAAEAQLRAKMEAAEAQLRTKVEAAEAKIEAQFAALIADLRAATAARLRQRNAAEPDPALQ